ncbi:MAG: DUF2062 domain-containing protein [Deltaproteobacteria bacterium]|nr:DUF2062 domain-containing protein [Deltaproteobacteria bacterium]
MKWVQSLKTQALYHYYQFVRLNATPEEVSRGLAIGVFVGMLPIYGVQILAAILLAQVLGENKLSASIGTFVTNPLTSIPIYLFNYKVGRLFIPAPENATLFIPNAGIMDQIRHLSGLSFEYLLTWILGCIIVGFFSAILTYWLSKPIYIYLRDRARMHQERKSLEKHASEKNSGPTQNLSE